MVPERDVLAPILVLGSTLHSALHRHVSTFCLFPPCPWPADGGDHWPLAGVRLDPVLGPAKDANWLLAVSSRATAATPPGQSREKGLGESFETLHGIAYWALGTGYRVYPLQNDCRVCKIPNVPDTRQCTAGDLWRLQQHRAGCCSAAVRPGYAGSACSHDHQDTCPFVSVRGNFTRL